MDLRVGESAEMDGGTLALREHLFALADAHAAPYAVLPPGERAQHSLRPLRRAGLSEHLTVQLHERVGGEDHGGGIV